MNGNRRLKGLAVVLACSFAVTVLLAIRDGAGSKATDSHQPSSLSYRPLGHRAFRKLLERLGHPAVVSRNASLARAGKGSLLCYVEPTEELEDLASDTREAAALIVLPKWAPPADWEERLGGKVEISILRTEGVEGMLEDLGVRSSVLRSATFVEPRGEIYRPISVRGPLQLLKPPTEEEQRYRVGQFRLVPLVEAREGILFAELRPRSGTMRPAYILSDPDLLANHGLERASNAEFMVGVVNSIVKPKAPVIFDEVSHGLYESPSLIRAIFSFPLALAAAQGLLLAAVLCWLVALRFGEARRGSRGIKAGKEAFIENVASLQWNARDAGHSLLRYHRFIVRDVVQRLGVQAEDQRRRMEILDAYGTGRGTSEKLSELNAQVARFRKKAGSASADAVLRLAARIHRWRREMLDEPRSTA